MERALESRREERGRDKGERLIKYLREKDKITLIRTPRRNDTAF